MFSFPLFTASCTPARKHALSKHNQKALETDYSSVTFGDEQLSQLQNMLCVIVPNQQMRLEQPISVYHGKHASSASGLILCITWLGTEPQMDSE